MSKLLSSIKTMNDEITNSKTQHNATNHNTKHYKMTNKPNNDKYLRPKAQKLTHKRTRVHRYTFHREFVGVAEIKNVLQH